MSSLLSTLLDNRELAETVYSLQDAHEKELDKEKNAHESTRNIARGFQKQIGELQRTVVAKNSEIISLKAFIMDNIKDEKILAKILPVKG
ncbi:hypothetical protein [Bacillus wiedmannii]|uniref:hypothetical protein n=1 Tax=Bacillus wiedmannii TaxID=1890302 RepID=UPI000BF0BC58|nr:hypothetical protein [Bacillus wiedmannii]PEM08528.1 hypothetical protein CN610_19950 [Bacillus wiedmannii]